MNEAMAAWKRGGSGRRWMSGMLCAAMLASTSLAGAQASPDDLARRHFESGVAYLQESDYENALNAFTKAYELSKRPEILLNIATVQERQGNLEGAVGSLEKYLVEAPDGEHVGTVELRLKNLRKRVEEAQQPDTTPQAPTAPPPTEPAPDAPPPSSPPPQAEQPPNIPAYVLLGIGGVAAGGAIITGILASSEHSSLEEECSPNCTDDQVSTGKTMALTSTVLTGVAVVSAGIGAALLFSDSGDSAPAEASAKPDVFVGVGPKGAQASATWRF